MADCKISSCRDLTKGTTFLCDRHWLLIDAISPDLQRLWRHEREQWRRYRQEVNWLEMQNYQERCLRALHWKLAKGKRIAA